MSTKPLDVLKDYLERSTHWQEGGADRHAALEALKALREQNAAIQAALYLSDQLCTVALPKFDWGASALNAEAIVLLNETPAVVAAALKLVKEQADVPNSTATTEAGARWPAAQPLTEAPAELRGLDTVSRVRFYEHDFYVLSNFSAFTLVWKGIRFDTSEAAYHFEKFTDADGTLADVRAIQYNIRTAPSAHEAFKIAERNKAHRRPDWDDVKVGVMLDILRAKAAQHEYVRRKLLATGIRELVEDSWRDDFWGWGPNRDGKNMLGRLWMQVRAELRAHGIGTAHA